MKVNFKSIPCHPSLKDPQEYRYDVAKDLGEEMYQKALIDEEFEFAQVIFNSEGEMEITEEQMNVVLKYIGGMPVWLQRAIFDEFRRVLTEANEEALRALNEAGSTEIPVEESLGDGGAEMIFEDETPTPPAEPEHIPGEPSPDGGVWAGEGGTPAPPVEEVPVVKEVKTKKTKKTKKK